MITGNIAMPMTSDMGLRRSSEENVGRMINLMYLERELKSVN